MAAGSSRIELRRLANATPASRDATVAVYSASVAADKPLLDSLRPWKISHQWHTWNDVDIYTLRAVPLVALVPRVTPAELEAILRFRQRYVGQPVVIVTEKDAENTRMLVSTGIEEIVWRCEVKEQLAAAVRRALDGSFFERLAQDIGDAEHFPPFLRIALARAVVRRSPILKVAQLAGLVGRDPATVWRYWKRSTDPNHELRVEDFLGWIILMRAIQRRSVEGAWHFAATAVGVDPRTLSRLARRLAGLSLHEIERLGFAAVAEQCREELLHRMLSPALQGIAAECNVLSL